MGTANVIRDPTGFKSGSVFLVGLFISFVIIQAQGQTPTCQEGWERYEDTCYFIFENLTTWDNATSVCSDMDGHLVTCDKKGINDFLAARVDYTSWIGLRVDPDYQNTEIWNWSDGTEYNQTWDRWRASYVPENVCGTLDGGTWWVSRECNNEYGYICKRGKTNPTCGNWEAYGTFCYYFELNSGVPYSEASTACLDKGAHLTSMENEDEFLFIRQHLQDNGITTEGTYLWIGLHPFHWVKPNSTYSWQNWVKDSQPTKDKMCTVIRNDGHWLNYECIEQFGFICEKEPQTLLSTTTTQPTTSKQSIPSGATSDYMSSDDMSTVGYTATGETTEGSEEEQKDDYTWVWVLMGSANGMAFIAFVILLIIYLRLRIKYGPLPSRRNMPQTDSSSDDFNSLDEIPADSGIDNRAFADTDEQQGAVGNLTGASPLYACVNKKSSTSNDIMTHRI